MTDWKPFFEMVSTVRGKCRECGVEMDVRAGRPQKHLRGHTDIIPPVTPAQEEAAPPEAEAIEPAKVAHPRGSKEWAIEEILAAIESDTATPDTKIKALALYKEYQQFGSSMLDDEKEVEAHNAQWDRVLKRVGELTAAEERLLRHPGVRVRLLERLGKTP